MLLIANAQPRNLPNRIATSNGIIYIYLDRDERRALLDAVNDEVRPFVRGLCLLPLRPGALADLKVRDFDKRTRAITVGKDKNGKPRQLTVPPMAADFFEMQVKGKLPSAPIFARSGGREWNKDAWKYPIKDAVTAAGLPHAATAYTLRHSVITDLIRARLPILTGLVTVLRRSPERFMLATGDRRDDDEAYR